MGRTSARTILAPATNVVTRSTAAKNPAKMARARRAQCLEQKRIRATRASRERIRREGKLVAALAVYKAEWVSYYRREWNGWRDNKNLSCLRKDHLDKVHQMRIEPYWPGKPRDVLPRGKRQIALWQAYYIVAFEDFGCEFSRSKIIV